MKKRSYIITIPVFVISFIFIANSAWAGSASRNLWKGIAIGVGAAVIGNAIYNHNSHHSYEKAVLCHEPFQKHQKRHQKSHGHWEVRKEWVPPTYKKVWNPGHYNRHGEWIEGHWMKIVIKQGCWIEKRVWVASNSKRHSERRRY